MSHLGRRRGGPTAYFKWAVRVLPFGDGYRFLAIGEDSERLLSLGRAARRSRNLLAAHRVSEVDRVGELPVQTGTPFATRVPVMCQMLTRAVARSMETEAGLVRARNRSAHRDDALGSSKRTSRDVHFRWRFGVVEDT